MKKYRAFIPYFLSAFIILVCAYLVVISGLPLDKISRVYALSDEWPTSLHDIQRTGSSNDTTFTASTAAYIKPLWTFKTGGVIASSPTVTGGVAYVGSWDGNEYALNAATGALKWKTFLGITTANPTCIPPVLGVSSAATVQNGVVYVGGGDSYWYALDASTGAVLWKVFTGDNSAAGGHYNWSSPLIYNGFAYIGVASLGDCPLVQGQLLKVDLSTHQIVNTLNIVPNGQVGGGIWTSPSFDPSTNTIYATTGTENAFSQQWAQAFLAIDANSLTVKDFWKLPETEAVLDSDFGTSATLFQTATGSAMVSAINKNGKIYAFNRTNLAAGPVWEQPVAIGGECPTCGQSSVSSGTFHQGKMFYAGASGVINNQGYMGTVRAFDTSTGNYIWQHGATGPIIGALASANGLIFDAAGSILEVLDASTGKRLDSFDTGYGIYAAPSVANGVLYTGNLTGRVYAFSLSNPVVPPSDSNCPSGWTCQDIGNPSPTGQENVASSSGSLSVLVGGSGIAGTADSFRFISKDTSGDDQVISQVASIQGTSAGAEAGLMIRQDNDPGSPYYGVFLKPDGGLSVQYRTAFGGTVSAPNNSNNVNLPEYLEIQRVGDRFQAATSNDGVNFTLVTGTDATVVMPDQVMSGLAVTSTANGSAENAAFAATVVASPNNTLSNPPSAHSCPVGWSCGDIGNPLLKGDQTLTNGVWNITGSGGDIWGNLDQFRMVWQKENSDASVSARITSQTKTSDWAKTGVMFRQSASADSAYYGVYLTPSNGIRIQYRDTKGLTASEVATVPSTPPAYVSAARYGNTFTAYTSTDGVNWTPVVGSSIDLPYLTGDLMVGLAVTSNNTQASSTSAVDSVNITASAPVPPNVCPSGWTCKDVGFPTPSGGQTLLNGVWTVNGGGGDIWGTYDQFHFINQPLSSDGSVSVHITSQTNTDPWARGGVMMRLSTDPSSPYYGLFVTPSNGIVVQYRLNQGATTTQIQISGAVPAYLKIARSGNTFMAYTSTDGISWTSIAGSSTDIPALAGTIGYGMVVLSHNPSAASIVTFNNVKLDFVTDCSGGWSCQDVGSPATAGSGSFNPVTSTFTISGAGNDIWQTDDQFRYDWQPLNGNGQITARVTSQTNTDPWAKAGVMIKESTASGSPYALMSVTPGNGLHMQYNFNGDITGGAYTFPNAWVRLQRSGNNFTSYSSTDGINWTAVGSTTVAMNASATVGLFVTSHNGGNLSTTTFDNVSISTTQAPPSPWQNSDIGSPGLAGSATYSNGIFSVNGSGNDIWQTLDQLQYVEQPLNGDGQIVARLTSQSNTDPWAKAGVMIKESTASGSPYALMSVTPGNGLHMQYNFNGDISGGAYAFPTWVSIKRTGNTFTSYSSTDGANWTQVGSTTLAMNTNATIGLFVTSHNNGALNTATFDNVSISFNGGPVPSPWSNLDIGSPGVPGSSSYLSGIFSVNGSGNDIWQTLDQLQYVEQSITGDATITAKVISQSNTDPWAKAGVMIKESTASGSPYALMSVTPGNGLHMQYNFNGDQSAGVYTFPQWIRLRRSGNTFTSYSSTDGVNWTQIGLANVTINSAATAGLFVTSHNNGSLSTATFGNVSLTQP